MKNLLIILLLFAGTIQAQRPGNDQIQALKTAHITQALNLTSEEAEKFWPIYNKHEERIRELKQSERQMIRRMESDLEGMSEKEADELLVRSIDHKKQMLAQFESLMSELKGVISNKKILLLQKAEEDFKRMLLRRMNERKKNRP